MHFINDYYIYTPKLHNENTRRLRCNPLLGDLTYELNEAILDKLGLSAVTFCFFVNWNNDFSDGVVDEHIWIKKGLHVSAPKQINIGSASDFDYNFLKCESLDKVKRKRQFFLLTVWIYHMR